MTQQTTGNKKEAAGKSQEVVTPASLFIDRNNVMTYGAEKGQYMPIGRCIDDMCACIAELEREAGCIYCNDWV